MIKFEWVAACVAPWTVSPHPNFPQNGLSAAGRLALITEWRSGEIERFPNEQTEFNEAEAALLEWAKRSLVSETQRESAAALADLARNGDLELGALASATLYASVAYGELDEPEQAVELLRELLERMGESGSYASTHQLTRAIIQLQLARRLFESAEFDASAVEAEAAVAAMPRGSSKDFEEFEVSKGISWGPKRVQLDLRLATLQRAEHLLARLEGIQGKGWVRIVKSRTSWPEMRLKYVSSKRDAAFVDTLFEKRIEAYRNRIRLGASDSTHTSALVELLVAELSGDLGVAMASAESLGKLLILRSAPTDVYDLEEGLRLLRQGQAREKLESSLQWVRSQGPIAALGGAARTIMRRPSYPKRVNGQDIAVLSAAADVLSGEELASALEGVWGYFGTPKRYSERGIAEQRRAWTAVARLAPESECDDKIAREFYVSVLAQPSLPRNLAGVGEQVLDALDWGRVSGEAIESWKGWVGAKRDVDDSDLRSALTPLLGLIPQDDLIADQPYERVVGVLDGIAAGRVVEPEQIDQAKMYAIGWLQALIDEAEGHSVGVGGVDAVDIGAALANATGDTALWAKVVSVLTNPKIDTFKKGRALDRVVSVRNTLPESALNALVRGWHGVRESRSDREGFFATAASDFGFPEGFRFAAAFRLEPRLEALAKVTQWAVAPLASDRIEAARTIPIVAETYDAFEWGQVLLLQMAESDDPNVASEASKNLVTLSRSDTVVGSLVSRNIARALGAEGIRRPLLTLHGYQKALTEDPAFHVEASQLEQIRYLSDSHLSRIVRGAASEVLRLHAGSK